MGKLLVVAGVALLIVTLWKKKAPAMPTTPMERFFRALGAATKAVGDSARARARAEGPAPPQGTPEPASPITLVRCPRCGGYLPAGQACTCT